MTDRFEYAKASPAASRAMAALQRAVYELGLERSLLDLVVLRASQINGCTFCIDMHWTDARAHGESELRLYMLSVWRESSAYTPRERAALAWTEEVTRLPNQQVSDEIYREARAQFDEAELTNLTLALVAINGWNRLNIAFHTPAAGEKALAKQATAATPTASAHA